MVSIVMLNVAWLNASNNHFMLSVFMPSVIMLSVMAPNLTIFRISKPFQANKLL
jgi:hypothetical protein